MQRFYPHTHPTGPYSRVGGVDAGECDAPFKVTWPSDVDNLKARINALVESTNLDVLKCTSLTAEQRQSWSFFLATWRAFNKEETPTFGSYGKWVNACAHAHTLDAWRDTLAKKCALSAPTDIHGAPDLTKAGETAQWVSKALIGGAALVAVIAFLPEIKALLPSRSSKSRSSK